MTTPIPQHLSSGLDTLARNILDDDVENLKPLREYIDAEWGGDQEKFDLLTRKGWYLIKFIFSFVCIKYYQKSVCPVATFTALPIFKIYPNFENE